MFLSARKEKYWLGIIDSILDTITRRNADFFTMYKSFRTKDEVVQKQEGHLRKLYNVVPSFEVIKLDEETGEFKVNRSPYKEAGRISHCINVVTKECTCGKWQDRAYPCIDAMAYFRNYEQESLEYILAKEVSSFYKYSSLYHLYRKNIKPVIISTLIADGETLPPGATNKRRAGRPQKKRARNRSKFEIKEESPVQCSFCTGHAHNVRNCPIKKQLQRLRSSQSTTVLDDAERAARMDPGYDRNMM